MNKETTNMEEDYDIDELLNEEEDTPVEMTEESQSMKIEKKGRGRPQGSVKHQKIIDKDNTEVPEEIIQVNKELTNMEWQSYAQPAYEGLQNIKTGEIINDKEILRRILCYAQEASRNSR